MARNSELRRGGALEGGLVEEDEDEEVRVVRERDNSRCIRESISKEGLEEEVKEERDVEDSLPGVSDISMPECLSWRFFGKVLNCATWGEQ